MRVLAAVLTRDPNPSQTRIAGPNPFTLSVQFEISTASDVSECAALMVALKAKRQDIQIRIGAIA